MVHCGRLAAPKVILIVIAIIICLCAFISEAKAEPQVSDAVTGQTLITKQVEKDTEIFEIEDKYLVIRERKAYGDYFITVLEEDTYKQINAYSLQVKGSGWDNWSYSDTRYQVLRRAVSEEVASYASYMVDLVAGTAKVLPFMSTDSELLPSAAVPVVLYRDSDQFLMYNLEKGASTSIGSTQKVKPYEWNQDGTEFAFADDGALKMYLAKTGEIKLIDKNKVTGFLGWCPDGNGFLYYTDGLLKYMQINGVAFNVGTYDPVLEELFNYPAMLQWNPSHSKAAIQDKTNKMYLLDFTDGTLNKANIKTIHKPEQDSEHTYGADLMDVFWSADGSDIQFMSYRVMGKMQYINDDFYIKNRQGKFELVSVNGADQITYYKNYILFLTEVSMMGTFDKFSEKMGIYDLNTGKLVYIDKIEKFEVTPDRNHVILYKNYFSENSQSSLLDESTLQPGKILPGIYWGSVNQAGGKLIFAASTPLGVTTFSVLNLSKTEADAFLTFNDREQYLVNTNKNKSLMAFAAPGRNLIYVHNGFELAAFKVAGTLMTPPFISSNIDSSGAVISYIEEIQGQKYLKVQSVPIKMEDKGTYTDTTVQVPLKTLSILLRYYISPFSLR